METYIVDAVAFLAYLVDKLPEKSDQIFKKAERNQVILYMPSIALGEVLYTIYKGKEIFGTQIPLEKIDLIFKILKEGRYIKLIGMDINAWMLFHGLDIPELHDRMIVATFRSMDAFGIITTDPEMAKSAPTMW